MYVNVNTIELKARTFHVTEAKMLHQSTLTVELGQIKWIE